MSLAMAVCATVNTVSINDCATRRTPSSARRRDSGSDATGRNSSNNRIGSVNALIAMSWLLLPMARAALSVRRPIQGSNSRSASFGMASRTPAIAGGTFANSVR
ncbi:hypothetical protein D3C85_1198670 [compost metagenome]